MVNVSVFDSEVRSLKFHIVLLKHIIVFFFFGSKPQAELS